MSAAACATELLRIGALTFSNDYRHPVVLAQELATLDVISGGRLEVGLGAGWMRADYEIAGIPMDSPSIRIARLAEAIEVFKASFDGAGRDFSGVYYRLPAHDAKPKPSQRPRPPILVGGSGPKLLDLAGHHADIVGFNVSLHGGTLDDVGGSSATRTAMLEKVAIVREAAGDRWADLELQVSVHAVEVDGERGAAFERAGRTLRLSPADVAESPHALVGSVDAIVDQLLAQRDELGISYISTNANFMDRLVPIVARLAGT
jgi:probable F420-dependent oxidoreductase